jgi:hypothetical protein
MIVSGGSPAAERAWLISASTCAAAMPPWGADGLAEAEAAADAEGWALAVPVPVGCGEREDTDADGASPVRAWRDGTVATAGGTAMATSAGLPAQGPVVAAPQPVAAVRGLAFVRPDAGPGEKTLRVK